MPRRRSRRRARQLSRVRPGAARHPRVLRREGQPGAGGADAAGRARLVLRHRLGRRDRDGARRRRDAGPHLLRQHDQEGARHRARPRARRAPVRGRLRGRGREDRPRRRPGAEARCSAASCATAPAPNGRCRASSAACRRWRSTCSSMPTASGLDAYGVSFHVGSQQRNPKPGTRRSPSASAIFRELRRARHHALRWSISAAASRRKYLKDVPAVEAYGEAIFRALAQALRQPHPGDDHRAGPRHGRRRRHDQGRGRARLEEVATRTRCAGSISTSASSAVSPRRWTRRSATRSARRATATEGALRPRRPDLRLGRRALREDAIRAAGLARDRRQGADRGTGAYTTTYSAVAFNGFPPLQSYVI